MGIDISKPIYILGTGLSHNGSTCLMKDGEIIVSIEKERLTGIKNDGLNDNLTVKYCLDAANITESDLSLIVEKDTLNLKHDSNDFLQKKDRFSFDNVPRIKISHHMAHAYCAIGLAPFENDFGVIVMDGRGASLNNCMDITEKSLTKKFSRMNIENFLDYYEKESYYIYKNNCLIPIVRDFSEYYHKKNIILETNDLKHSLAQTYGAFSQFIFGKENCEWKTMNLSKKPIPFTINSKIFNCKDGFVEYDHDNTMKTIYNNTCYAGNNFYYSRIISNWIQRELNRATKYLFDFYYNQYPMSNVTFSGGLALNTELSDYLRKNTNFSNIYVPKYPNDAGLSIGCCYYGWLNVLKKEKVPCKNILLHGKSYNDNDVLQVLNKNKNAISFEKCNNATKYVAEQLKLRKQIVIFNFASEFGPNSYGNRVILANPKFNEHKIYVDNNYEKIAINKYFLENKKIGIRNISINTIVEILQILYKEEQVEFVFRKTFKNQYGIMIESVEEAMREFINSSFDELIINNKYIVRRKHYV